MLGISRKQGAKDYQSKGNRPHRDVRRHYAQEDKSLPFVEEEPSGILVKPENLQATFENLVSVISSDEGASFSKTTVQKMIESIYEWMVFDDGSQIVLPSSPGANTTRRMWPHGSKVDTRRKRDRSTAQSSPMRLKEVGKDHVHTVASSVVSSVLEGEGARVKKGSVTYIDQPHPGPSSHGGYGGGSQQGQPYQSSPYPVQNIEYAYPPLDHTRHPPQMVPLASSYFTEGEPKRSQRQERVVPRYSIIGGPVAPPERVEETPQLQHVETAHKRTAKKTRVGASARPANATDEGTPVIWGD